MRQEAVAGKFYKESFDELDKELNECFTSKFGPGDLPAKRKESKIKGIISPHAGYAFSGACAAWGFMEIAENEFPDCYIIIGPSHYGNKSGISLEDWRTPFGMVRNAKDVSIALKNNTDLVIDEEIHEQEHSIEMQVPMLQFVNKDNLNSINIVPILIGRDIEYKKLAFQISEVLKDLNKSCVFIISSDFTHYGPNYKYVPFTLDVPKSINKLDKGAIEKIISLDVEGFADYLNSTMITICGYMPILLFMSILQNQEYKGKASMLMHYTSGDILNDFKNSVRYASILFKD